MTPAISPIMWLVSCGKPSIPKEIWPAIVNRFVNNGMDKLDGFPPLTSGATYWPKAGWCIDFAWTKREELLRHEYLTRELLLCECELDDNGGRHMVLLVNGMVLDSIIQHVYPMSEMPYKIVRQQSPTNPNNWETP